MERESMEYVHVRRKFRMLSGTCKDENIRVEKE